MASRTINIALNLTEQQHRDLDWIGMSAGFDVSTTAFYKYMEPIIIAIYAKDEIEWIKANVKNASIPFYVVKISVPSERHFMKIRFVFKHVKDASMFRLFFSDKEERSE